MEKNRIAECRTVDESNHQEIVQDGIRTGIIGLPIGNDLLPVTAGTQPVGLLGISQCQRDTAMIGHQPQTQGTAFQLVDQYGYCLSGDRETPNCKRNRISASEERGSDTRNGHKLGSCPVTASSQSTCINQSAICNFITSLCIRQGSSRTFQKKDDRRYVHC